MIELKSKTVELRKQAHSVYRCEYHIMWITKFRFKILKKGARKFLEIKLREVRKYHPEIEYLNINIKLDHIHMLVSFPPKYSISSVVRIIKSNTGRELMQKFDFIKRTYYRARTVWSPGYFASTVGLDESVMKKYIRYQEKEDLGQAKLGI